MQATAGRVVLYTLTSADAEQIARRRADFTAFNTAHRDAASGPGEFPGRSGHIGHVGSPVAEGDVFPAVVTQTTGPRANLKIWLDGNDDYWARDIPQGKDPGTWSFPPSTSPLNLPLGR